MTLDRQDDGSLVEVQSAAMAALNPIARLLMSINEETAVDRAVVTRHWGAMTLFLGHASALLDRRRRQAFLGEIDTALIVMADVFPKDRSR